ncbi:NAD(P)H-hydrate dehydratase [Ottowia thiooxydans]
MPRLIQAHEMHPLHDAAATRRTEHSAAAQLPAHTLMQRAGLAVARLALALTPHARTIWIACGPGNNGGDGLEAALHLRHWGLNPVVTWLGNPENTPADAHASYLRARDAGVNFAEEPPELDADDLCIDALLGLGAARPPQGLMAEWLDRMATCPSQRLAVDLPTGLSVDTGSTSTPWHADAHPPRHHTLSLLTLKPGLFTMQGRDACGTMWFDDLGIVTAEEPVAWLNAPGIQATRPHASHKGTWGDVAVIGGESDASRGISMRGAALLAARAALSSGAGRVYVSLLGNSDLWLDTIAPALMFRRFDALDFSALTSVCGCGGGETVAEVLPALLAAAPRLVLDADALNVIARDPKLKLSLANRDTQGHATVLTPHPLEAARLLACSAAEVQADRLACARELTQRFRSTVVLKGSGTVIAAPDQLPNINPTGNARLATAGTGDVLAGMIGARMAAGLDAFSAARTAVWQHGHFADLWPDDLPLTAERLATPP